MATGSDRALAQMSFGAWLLDVKKPAARRYVVWLLGLLWLVAHGSDLRSTSCWRIGW